MLRPVVERRAMVDIKHSGLSILRQCNLLSVSRSSFYYKGMEENPEDLKIMRFLDKQYFLTPFYGIRKLTKLLHKNGIQVNRKRVRRLMRKVNWKTLYRAPNTSLGNKEHKIYPYLLRDIKIDTMNQVWSTDITYIPMKRGFIYLCAVIDVHTRFVVGWSISNTMSSEWCLNTLKEAMEMYGKPGIVNTDQGSQFTSHSYTQYLQKNGIKISMDGKGRAIDNIWIERLWRSVKYEDVYLKSYASVNELEIGIEKYFYFYNHQRLHETLEYKTPKSLYYMAA